MSTEASYPVVILYKLSFIGQPPKPGKLPPGVDWLCVYPNNKHGDRNWPASDGMYAAVGMSSLSPMRMGPITPELHRQAGLPMCKLLENFHQGNKHFAQDVDNSKQLELYADDVPHRHKYKRGMVPLYSLYIDHHGTEHHLTYIESRELYCCLYQYFAERSPEFARLKELAKTTPLCICGYDAHDPSDVPLTAGFLNRVSHMQGFPMHRDHVLHIHAAYLSTAKPFGHELCLYAMLIIENPVFYPWAIHGQLRKSGIFPYFRRE
jgi:hypothetical protein